MKLLDDDGLRMVWQKLKAAFFTKTAGDTLSGKVNTLEGQMASAASFDFDNCWKYPGMVRTCDATATDTVTTTVKYQATGVTLATRVSVISPDGNTVTSTQTVYNSNGTISSSVKATTTLAGDIAQTSVVAL